jgi:hypothetical protein
MIVSTFGLNFTDFKNPKYHTGKQKESPHGKCRP